MTETIFDVVLTPKEQRRAVARGWMRFPNMLALTAEEVFRLNERGLMKGDN